VTSLRVPASHLLDGSDDSGYLIGTLEISYFG